MVEIVLRRGRKKGVVESHSFTMSRGGPSVVLVESMDTCVPVGVADDESGAKGGKEGL